MSQFSWNPNDGEHGGLNAARLRRPQRRPRPSARALRSARRPPPPEELGAGVASHQPVADLGQPIRVGDRRQHVGQASGGIGTEACRRLPAQECPLLVNALFASFRKTLLARKPLLRSLTSSSVRTGGTTAPAGATRSAICRIQSTNARCNSAARGSRNQSCSASTSSNDCSVPPPRAAGCAQADLRLPSVARTGASTTRSDRPLIRRAAVHGR